MIQIQCTHRRYEPECHELEQRRRSRDFDFSVTGCIVNDHAKSGAEILPRLSTTSWFVDESATGRAIRVAGKTWIMPRTTR